MSSSQARNGQAQQPSPDAAQAPKPQFAQGGNSSYSEAQPEPVLDQVSRQTQASDTLVMLQLASFEGRAI